MHFDSKYIGRTDTHQQISLVTQSKCDIILTGEEFHGCGF
jgi:hypothetical protein